MSRPNIVKWCQKFEDSRLVLTDAEREERQATMSTPGMMQRVEDIIRSNRRLSVAHIAEEHFKEHLGTRQISNVEQTQTAVLNWL